MKKGLLIKIALPVVIVAAVFTIYTKKNSKKSEGITVKEWNNMYSENHIDFFYYDNDNNKIKLLNDNYKVSEKFKTSDKEVDNALKSADWIRSTLDVDSISKHSASNGYDLLNQAQADKKASASEIVLIERDILKCINVPARTGNLRIKPKKGSDVSSYSVLEFYSESDKKWIMLDVINRRVFKKDGKYLSAIEFLETSNPESVTYENKQIKEVNRIKDFKYSYSVNLDNTIANKNSNSSLTYCTKNDLPVLNDNNSYYEPQIFTDNKKLFSLEPSYKSEELDTKPHLIIMFGDLVEKDKTEYPSIIVGAFRDSRMVKEYYVKVNDGKMTEVSKYQSVTLKKGTNKIILSEDGTKESASIEIEYK